MAGVGTHRIVAELIDPPSGPVIDVGPGQGAFATRLVDAGYDVAAIGIHPQQYIGTAPLVHGDLDRGLPFRSASLHGIVAIEVIEHLENPLWFVREACRCLIQDGWLIVTTPNVRSVAARLSVLLRGHPTYFGEAEYRLNGHINPVSVEQVERIAERCGLAVEIVTYNVGKMPIPWIRHRFPLRQGPFRTGLWGECVIVRLRKTAAVPQTINRG
jgi:SAM-dependent methyltransferase